MNLFDVAPLVGQRGMHRAESTYLYLAGSERRSMVSCRDLLETWFARYPIQDQDNLRSLFRYDFDAAFFELLMHELLLRLDGEVHVHPDLGTGLSTRPDFLVLPADESPYVVEVTVANDESDEEAGVRRVRDEHNCAGRDRLRSIPLYQQRRQLGPSPRRYCDRRRDRSD